jgi:hypothetical protein
VPVLGKYRKDDVIYISPTPPTLHYSHTRPASKGEEDHTRSSAQLNTPLSVISNGSHSSFCSVFLSVLLSVAFSFRRFMAVVIRDSPCQI